MDVLPRKSDSITKTLIRMPESEDLSTFFPDSKTSLELYRATSEEMAAILQKNSNQMAMYVHEFLRTGKIEDLRAAFIIIENLPSLLPVFVQDLASVAVVMQTHMTYDKKASHYFVKTCIKLINEVQAEFAVDENSILNLVDKLVLEYVAGQN